MSISLLDLLDLQSSLWLTNLGIAYQLVPHDPLVDTEQCKRDIVRMSELGVNSIRVYHVDAHADHKGCMDAFAHAGIYLFVDLDTFDTQIEQVSRALEYPLMEAIQITMARPIPSGLRDSSSDSKLFSTNFRSMRTLRVSSLAMKSLQPRKDLQQRLLS